MECFPCSRPGLWRRPDGALEDFPQGMRTCCDLRVGRTVGPEGDHARLVACLGKKAMVECVVQSEGCLDDCVEREKWRFVGHGASLACANPKV